MFFKFLNKTSDQIWSQKNQIICNLEWSSNLTIKLQMVGNGSTLPVLPDPALAAFRTYYSTNNNNAAVATTSIALAPYNDQDLRFRKAFVPDGLLEARSYLTWGKETCQ